MHSETLITASFLSSWSVIAILYVASQKLSGKNVLENLIIWMM